MEKTKGASILEFRYGLTSKKVLTNLYKTFT